MDNIDNDTKIQELDNRVQYLEQIIKQQFGVQYYNTAPLGQRQIPSNPARTESGMGPLLNTNSDFL